MNKKAMPAGRQGFAQIIVVIAAIIALALAGTATYLFVTRPTANPTGSATPSSYVAPVVDTTQAPVPAVKSAQDLTTVSNDLDKTNIDSMNSQLDQNTADAAGFAPRIRVKNGTSTNWSGYAVETSLANPQNNAVSSVKGSWTVPSITCGPTETSYSAMWLGIDGYSDNTVEQTGTSSDCRNGVPTYYAWYEMYPKPSFRINIPVSSGDTINAQVSYVNGKFVLTLNNATKGRSFTTTQKSKAQRQSAEWVMEAPWSGGVLPLANFGAATFTGAQATLNGRTGSISDALWQFDKITMINSSGNPKATPSSLSADGTSFSVVWNSN